MMGTCQKILILSDESSEQDYAEAFLRDLPFRPVAVSSGLEASEAPGLLREAVAVLNGTAALDVDILADLDRCRVIANHSRGSVDVAAAAERGIRVANVRMCDEQEIVEHLLELVFALWLGISPPCSWRPAQKSSTSGSFSAIPTLKGMRLGICGCHRVLPELIDQARSLGFEILVHGRREFSSGSGAESVDLGTLLRRSDFLIAHDMLSGADGPRLGERDFRMMKPKARLVYGGCPEMLDVEALARALRDGWISGAAMNVPVLDPASFAERFDKSPNALVTPYACVDGFPRGSDRLALEHAVDLVIRALGWGNPDDVADMVVAERS